MKVNVGLEKAETSAVPTLRLEYILNFLLDILISKLIQFVLVHIIRLLQFCIILGPNYFNCCLCIDKVPFPLLYASALKSYWILDICLVWCAFQMLISLFADLALMIPGIIVFWGSVAIQCFWLNWQLFMLLQNE